MVCQAAARCQFKFPWRNRCQLFQEQGCFKGVILELVPEIFKFNLENRSCTKSLKLYSVKYLNFYREDLEREVSFRNPLIPFDDILIFTDLSFEISRKIRQSFRFTFTLRKFSRRIPWKILIVITDCVREDQGSVEIESKKHEPLTYII